MAIWNRTSGAMSTTNNRINYRVRVVLNSQHVNNNTSNVTVSVEVWRNNTGYTTRGTGTVYVTIDGTSYSESITPDQLFTYNSNTKVFTRTLNISHNSSGAKNLGVSARISHQQFSSNNQSYSTALNTIPRASELVSFSFASQLQASTGVTINYNVSRKSGDFLHQIRLLDGSHQIREWDNVSSNGDSTLPLTATEVNSILNRMSSSTSRSLTLRIATRNSHNGGWVGGAVTRNATVTINANVKPTVSSITIGQMGNSVSSHILQTISRVTARFTPTAGYGASITSNSITIRRKSSNNDVQTINSSNGTTSRAVALSGKYEAQATARDSRGRSTSSGWQEFDVTAYSTPRITEFTASRNSGTPTTVNISRKTTHTNLGTSNPLTYSVQRRLGTGAWTNVNTNASGSYNTSPLTNGSSTSTGNSVTSSYDFRMIVTDKFNNRAESIVSVSTQRVVLDIHKNDGVGIGKIHERGVLDVDGEAYFQGAIHMPFIATEGIGHQGDFNTLDRTSFYHIGSTSANHPSGNWGFLYSNSDSSNPNQSIRATHVSQIFHERDDNQNIYSRAKTNGVWKDWKLLAHIEEGGNANGRWIRFSGGLQICYMENFNVKDYHSSSVLKARWTYPIPFLSSANQPDSNIAVFITKNDYTDADNLRASSEGSRAASAGTYADIVVSTRSGMQSGWVQPVRVLAIGRWRN